MKTASIKKNFIFNLVRNISMILFPMITFPYLSRVLEPEGIGKINFANSIIQYFIMIASLGIPLYGTREIAKVRDKRNELNQTVNELLQINLLSTLIAYTLFIILYNFVPRINKESLLFLVTSFNIIFTTIGIEWFYQGIEKYEFITKRVLIVRIISIILMFLLVKTKEDYIVSAIISVLGNVGANIFNFIYAKKYIKYKLFKKYNLKKHIKPILIIFGMSVAISIYINLDSVMLGFLKGDEAVGYYTASIKLNKMVLSIITSLGVVLIPRLSYYIAEGLEREYKTIVKKAFNFIVFISLPSMLGLIILSKNIIILFSGENFYPAITTMKIITPIIFFISLTNFIGIQILYPLNKEKIVFYSVIIGAITNFSLNLLLIPKYSQNGAAISTVIAEFSVLVVQIMLGKKYLKVKLIDSTKLKYLFASIIMGLMVYLTNNLFGNIIVNLFVSIFLGSSVYLLILLILKEELVLEMLKKVFRRFNFNV